MYVGHCCYIEHGLIYHAKIKDKQAYAIISVCFMIVEFRNQIGEQSNRGIQETAHLFPLLTMLLGSIDWNRLDVHITVAGLGVLDREPVPLPSSK